MFTQCVKLVFDQINFEELLILFGKQLKKIQQSLNIMDNVHWT